MSWVAAGTSALSLGTSALGFHKQSSAQKHALEAQQNAYSQQQRLMEPYQQAGTTALGQLSALNAGDYSGFNSSPDYRYAKQQMTDSADTDAAAKGLLYSGSHSVDLARRIGGLASQNLGNYRSSLMSLAGNGQQAASSLSGAAGQLGQAQANSALAKGDSQSQLYGAIGGTLANLGGNIATRLNAPSASQSTYGSGSQSAFNPSDGSVGNYSFGQYNTAGSGLNSLLSRASTTFGNNLYGWGG